MRILIVEDDPLVAMMATMALEDAGHDVVGPAHDADEACRLAAGRAPDLALLDVDLAGHDEGLALARRFKDDFGLSSLYVTGQVSAARGQRWGALGVLGKPYDPDWLVAAVEVAGEMLAGGSAASLARAPRPGPGSLEIFAPQGFRPAAQEPKSGPGVCCLSANRRTRS